MDTFEQPRRVLLAGGSGVIGYHLQRHLHRRGDEVRQLVRRTPHGLHEIAWDPDTGRLSPAALDGVDAVINLGGAGLGDRRWSAAYRHTITRSRIRPTALLAEHIAQEITRSGRTIRFLQASAVGYYGNRGDDVITEDSDAGSGFLAELCQQWEAATQPAQQAGASVALLRTGIVLAPRGGALGPMMPLLRLGLAGPLAGGRQWWPWISLVDHVRAQLHLLTSTVQGPINLSAPVICRQGEVIAQVAAALRRPAHLPVPRFALRAVLGPFADEVLASQRMLPQALLDDGFTFHHPHIAPAAAWVARGIKGTARSAGSATPVAHQG